MNLFLSLRNFTSSILDSLLFLSGESRKILMFLFTCENRKAQNSGIRRYYRHELLGIISIEDRINIFDDFSCFDFF